VACLNQRSQTQISKRENYVEVPVHVAMVQKVMAVETEENAGALDVPLFRQMHAPMKVLVGGMVVYLVGVALVRSRSAAIPDKTAETDYRE